MEIKNVPISELKPHPMNPRVHPDSALDKLEKSIKEFGWTNPVLVSKDGYILAGHARTKAAEKAGLTEVPVIELELEGDMADAYLIADNKLQDETDWDMEKLKLMFDELNTNAFPTELTGFEADEIEELMADFNAEEENGEAEDDGFDPDAAIEEIDEPVTKRGDVWQLGRHRLMCGDSTDEKDIDKLLDGQQAHMVFTDPPWNVNYGAVKDGNAQGYKPRTIKNDHMSTDEFKGFMDSAFENMARVTVDGGMVYVVMSAQEWGNVMLSLFETGFHWSSTIIWNKDRLVLSRKDYHTKYEPIWYGWKTGAPRIHPLDDRKQSDVWDFERPTTSEEHPTMKPIPLVARAVENSSKPGSNVLDIFGGSGTTLMACEQKNRTNFTMELDEKYCDVIVRRWEEFTGQKATKIG